MSTDRGTVLPHGDLLVERVNKYGIAVVAGAYEVTRDAVWRRLSRAGYRVQKMGVYKPTYVKKDS